MINIKKESEKKEALNSFSLLLKTLFKEKCEIADERNQLLAEKYNLIAFLEKSLDEMQEKVRTYENMRRGCNDKFYKKSYQTTIHKLNAKRETMTNILKMLKGGNLWKLTNKR